MKLQFVVSDQTNPYWNIAVENHLLSLPETDVVTLYLWKNRRTVVIGQNQNPYSEVNLEALKADGGYLMRRRTGGGAVYHDDGNLNFSFIVPKALYDQQRQFLVIQHAVESFGLHTELSGRNDILVTSDLSGMPSARPTTPNSELKKFSGNAFSKGKYQDLHHGTLLIDGNIDDLQRYLKPKPAKLQKHGVASVRSRVVNLSELNPAITSESIVQPLRSAFEAIYGAPAADVGFADIISQPAVRALYDEFVSDEWLYGRWRSFTAQRDAQFDWGGVEVSLTVEDNIIRDVQISSDALDTAAILAAQSLLSGATTDTPPTTDNPIVRDIITLVYQQE